MRIQPKKSLGQNFLIDQNIRKKITASLDLSPDDIILEIGAGSGEMTVSLAPHAGQVFALELDPRLYSVLKGSFAGYAKIRLIQGDILKLDLNELLRDHRIEGKVKVFGNIPYYISSPIIEHLLNFRERISRAFLMVQKEFAARVAAEPGSKDYGSFSCFVQYYASPQVLFHISRHCFKPAPKVDSSFLELEIREAPAVKVRDEELFFKIIRAAFNQRRKTLRNSLSELVPEQILKDFFAKTGLDYRTRPERLKLENFALLADLASIRDCARVAPWQDPLEINKPAA
ncbi:MAG: 16S rRNA (adenine(1518)-N(6)/adenine(1519)-N(6))-dimethyltransferase RsmA [Candidatus Omnitrophota bacterium]